MADEIPRSRRNEARGDNPVRILWIQHVARDLFADESVIGFVGVERADDIVPVRPRIVPPLVLVVAVRVAIVDHIKPMPPPTFTVAGRIQQAIDQFLVGIGVWIGHERVDLLRSRRQPVQVVRQPSDQRAPVGFRAMCEPARFQLREDEPVDVVLRPFRLVNFGNSRPFHWFQGPMLFPLCARVDPRSDQLDFFGGQRLAEIGGGHLLVRIVARDAEVQFAVRSLPGNNRRQSGLLILVGVYPVVQPQIRLPFGCVGTMAHETILGENGPNVPVKLDIRTRLRLRG